MRASLGVASGEWLLMSGALWAMSVGAVGAWCWRLAGRVDTLVRVSRVDPLTGLLNGRVFTEERWPAALRTTDSLGLLFVDLDHLKQHNDTHGYAAGNRYIARAAEVLRSACRRGVDEVFRLHTAGDEFVIVVRGGTARGLACMASSLVERFRCAGLSASVGAAWTESTGHRARADLFQRAEAAKGAAKAAGKGCAVVAPGSAQCIAADAATAPHSIGVLLRQVVSEAGAMSCERVELEAADDLSSLSVADEPFGLAATWLVLHGLRTACGPVRLRAHLERAAASGNATSTSTHLVLQLCAETAPHADALLSGSLRTCEAQGGSWHIEPAVITLRWPLRNVLAQAPRPSRALDRREP